MKSHASMNRIYRLVWNAALSLWVAVAENARGRSKGGSARTRVDGNSVHQGDGGHGGDGGSGGHGGFTLNTACRAALALIVATALFPNFARAADAAHASVSAGAGSVATAGSTTTITQASQRLAIDWTSLSTRANEALVFNQPNAAAIALNRITGTSPSELLGSLTANGQVFILNPNGVLFGAGSQVNVGGIVASTLSMSNADFMAGNHVFTNSGGTGSVINQGTMTAAQGGYLALLAPEVRNEGVMTASLGTALLAAGNKVTLNLDNGSLLGYSIDQGAINALAENKQLIKADGGQVLLSAKAMDALTTATVNNTGIIEAKTLQNKAGRIMLMGDMETGTVNVGGTLDASAPSGGDGGFIETSAAHAKVATGTKVTTLAASGKTGKWLIDPNDFNIDSVANNGDMDAATVASNLATTDFEIQTATMGTAGSGDINVNEALSWNSAQTLTLTAQRNININQAINATNGGLTLNAVNQISAPAAVNVGTFTLAGGSWSQMGTLPAFSAADFRITGGSFLRTLGGDGSVNPYIISDVYGLQGAASASMLNSYMLANNIDASGTANWNAGAGFKPIGNMTTGYSGAFNGNNNTISNLTINRPTEDYVGLFGRGGLGGSIQNVGLINVNVRGRGLVGGLVGFSQSYLSKTYVQGSVNGSYIVGGLVGQNQNLIVESYSTGSVTSDADDVGGLVGTNQRFIYRSYSTSSVNVGTYGQAGGLVGRHDANGSDISNSYATGNVTGGVSAGGLVGTQSIGTVIRNSYATGSVTGGGLDPDMVGALVGESDGRITSSFWLAGATRGIGTFYDPTKVNSLTRGLSSAEFKSTATFTNAAWQVSAVGGADPNNNVWRIYEGNTGPLLLRLLTGLTLADSAVTYNGGTQQGTTTTDPRVQGSSASGRNAGSYASGYYSDQQGVDIIGGSLTVSKANLVLTSSDVSKTYDGGTTAAGTAVATASTTLLGGDTATGGSFAFADKNAGTANKTVTASGVTVNDGNGGNNYNISYIDNTTSTINKADLTVTASTVTKTYDGTTSATGAGTVAALAGAAAGELVDSAGTQAFLDKNAGVANKNVRASGVTIKDASNADVTGNYNIAYIDNTLSTINKASLTLAAASDSKTYDGTTASAAAVSNSGLVGGDTVTAVQSFGSKNVMGAGGSTLSVDAGYTIADGNNGGNYNVTTTTAAGTINKASLTLAAVTDTKTYDGTRNSSLAVSAVGLFGSDSVTADQSFGSKNVLGAGNSTLSVDAGYTVADGNSGGNYNVTTTTAAGTINKASLTLAAVTDTKTYDATTASTAAVSKIGLAGGDSITGLSQSFASKNAMGAGGSTLSVDGGYTVADGNNGGNYNVTTTTAGGTINKASLTLTAVTDTKTYDGTVASSGIVGNSGLVGGDTVSAVQSFGSKNVMGSNGSTLSVDAGYTVADGNGGGNYNVTTTTAAGTINKASLTLAAVTDSKTYDATTASSAAVSKTGLAGGDTVSAVQSFGSKNVMGSNGSTLSIDAGYIVADGNGGGNYNVTTTTAVGTINKASLTLAAVTDTKTYDATTASSASVMTTGLQGSDSVTADQSFGSKNVLGAGNSTLSVDAGYTVADGNSGGNYNVTTTTAAGTINKANLTLAAVTDTKTYDATTASTAAVSKIGLAGGDTVTAAQSFGSRNVMGTGGSTLSVDAGYTVADGNGGGNYNVTTTTAAGTINKASLTLAAVTDTKTYDATTASTAAVSKTGLLGSDSVTSLSQSFGSKNVMGTGGSTLSVDAGYTVADGNGGGNYNVTTTTAAGTINKASLTLAAVTDTKTYDGTVASSGVVGNTGLVGGDTVTAVQAFGSKNVMGSNGSTLSVAGYTLNDGNSGGNYNVTTTTAAGTINKATLNLTATPDDKVYDGTTLATASYTDNRIAGDVLTYTATASFATKNVGNGIAVTVGGITTSGTDAGNYTVGSTTVVGNTADITPKTLTVTANDDSKMTGTPYSGGNGVTYSGIVAGETVAGVLTGSLAYSGNSQGANTPGEYDITPGGLVANSNYRVNFVDGTLNLESPPSAVSVQLKLLQDIPTLSSFSKDSALFKVQLATDIASALGISAGRVSVVSLGGDGGGGSSGGGAAGGGDSGGSGGSNSPNAAGNALNAAAAE